MSDHLMVAAIDFGTTYSGYAFSTISDFKQEPLKISANQVWNAGQREHLSLKTPTCLLLNNKQEIVSFGYEAENGYAELALEERHHDHYFFSRFKMRLYNNKDLTEDMRLEDLTGKSMLALDVFALSIKALKEHLLKILETRGTGVTLHEIKWVLTVPAIWPDSAKQFMRKSADKAGIDDRNLFIALEPEAASIYCQYLPTEKLTGATKGFTMAGVGQTYMVIDLGGGTADITVHEKLSDGHLKEICHASGGNCGGTSVDDAFIKLMIQILGARLINSLKQKEPSEYLDLLRDFETAKCKVEPTSTGKISFKIPCATINSLCEAHECKTLSSMIMSSPFASRVEVKGDKIRIDANIMRSLFANTIEQIISLVRNVLKKRAARNVQLFLLVGGFADCLLVQNAFKREFGNTRIIVPEEAGLSVLKGAVLFGHKSDYIASRVMRYTYGTNMNYRFDPAIHDPNRMMVSFGKEYCNGTFSPIMLKNKSVSTGTIVKQSYTTSRENQNKTCIEMYASDKENVMYIDDESCRKIGEAEVDIPYPSEEERSVSVEYIFGNTEISMTAKDNKYGTKCNANFKLI